MSDEAPRGYNPRLAKTITIYGRKPVLEALQDPSLSCLTLHWARSNQAKGVGKEIIDIAAAKGIECREHSRDTLSRISRNGKQDQGVALDILCPSFATPDALAERGCERGLRVLALDGITNPQNVGMIIRSAVAGGIDAIIYPRKGVAAMGPLVIKASVGTVFRAPLVYCDELSFTLNQLKQSGFSIASLEGSANVSLFEYQQQQATIFVLGSETDGVSKAISAMADIRLRIPMAAGIESLNVAVAASLIAYAPSMTGQGPTSPALP